MAIVYTHTRLDTNKIFYVGVGKNESRAYCKYRNNSHWNNVVNKTGYKVDITHRDICIEEALCIEQYLISFYGRKDFGKGELVNKTDGGDGVRNPSVVLSGEKHPNWGKKASEETRKKMSLSGKIKPKISESTIQKKRVNMTGDKNPMWGRKKELSPVYGKKYGDEVKRKISEAKKGKPNPAMSGEKNPNYGKCGGKNVAAKKVIDVSNGKIWECALYAAKELGMAATTLRSMLNGWKKNNTTLRYL